MLYIASFSRRKLPIPRWVTLAVICGFAATIAVKTLYDDQIRPLWKEIRTTGRPTSALIIGLARSRIGATHLHRADAAAGSEGEVTDRGAGQRHRQPLGTREPGHHASPRSPGGMDSARGLRMI
jgi:hypothetical protein